LPASLVVPHTINPPRSPSDQLTQRTF
jgi:hypothetical protein